MPLALRLLRESSLEASHRPEPDPAAELDEMGDMVATFLLLWNADSCELEQIIEPKEVEMAVEPEIKTKLRLLPMLRSGNNLAQEQAIPVPPALQESYTL